MDLDAPHGPVAAAQGLGLVALISTMAQPQQQLLSPMWYKVAALRPRLRAHVRIHRHRYRGGRWYVLQDPMSRRSHRFDPHAYFVIGLMNGSRTMGELWDATVARFGDETPTQDELIRLVAQLHMADMIQCDVVPDIEELLRRSHRIESRTRLARWLAPLAVRIPLIDPDRFLTRWLAWYRPFFGAGGALLWLAVVGWGAVGAVQHWELLTEDLTSRVLAAHNLLILALVFPVLKLLHEFGHACAVKAWGGEVHEMGIMLLVLMPIPYMDASSASAFPEKRRRVVVGCAGMMVELFVASAALALWLEMQPGFAKAVLFNVMLIAGISTVLFNANPLLRFDGYYILADLVEIPNLRQRSQQYLGGVFERRLFRMDVPSPEAGIRERAWMGFFAIASFVYRVFITLAIAAFIATQYFLIGVVLAVWAIVGGILLPILSLLRYLAFSPRLRRYRLRAAAWSLAALGVLGWGLFGVPVASWTNAQGVLWDAEQSAVRSATDSFVVRMVAQPGARVRRGEVLLVAADPLLAPRIRALEAQREELGARYEAERLESLVRAQMRLEGIKALEAELARMRERSDDLVLRSPSDGVFAVPAAQDLPGRFLKKGELVGFVVPEGRATARVVVPQTSVQRVREATRAVSAKLAERLEETYPAHILREVPLASDRLPSLALSQAGGGDIALDPSPTAQAKALQTHFEFEVELVDARPSGAGGRVYVRFDHPPETIAVQSWRALQQTFLQRFSHL
jgi:putative peptide zinc metalloprotease protein